MARKHCNSGIICLCLAILGVLVLGCGVNAKKDSIDTATSYFSDDYQEARHKFLNAAHAQGFRIESYSNPITGPNGRALFTDVASFGAENPEVILVVSSGTHGVEGFAGSAIQTGLFQRRHRILSPAAAPSSHDPCH